MIDEENEEAICEECGGRGVIPCMCGGDFCVCELDGEVFCPRCGGT